jgi:hypothetical protein
MSKQTPPPSLEQRAASAASSDTMSSAELAKLIEEVDVGIVAADRTAVEQKNRALDPALAPDPRVARNAMEDAQFAADRLRTLRPRLLDRYDTTRDAEERKAWHAEADELEKERDWLAAELKKVYTPELVGKLIGLFGMIVVNNNDIKKLALRSPPNNPRRLSTADPRGIVWNTKLPSPDGEALSWPPTLPKVDAAAAFVVPVVDDRRFSGDWWKCNEEQAERAAQRAAAEAEQKEREAAEGQMAMSGFVWWKQQRSA